MNAHAYKAGNPELNAGSHVGTGKMQSSCPTVVAVDIWFQLVVAKAEVQVQDQVKVPDF